MKKPSFCIDCDYYYDYCDKEKIEKCEERIFDEQNQDTDPDYYSDADPGL